MFVKLWLKLASMKLANLAGNLLFAMPCYIDLPHIKNRGWIMIERKKTKQNHNRCTSLNRFLENRNCSFSIALFFMLTLLLE